jgi:uncharacterized damage-inducible protein DinB
MELGTFLVRQYRTNAAMTRRMLDAVTSDLTEDELNWQAHPGHHSIWHNVWHMFLSNDYYFAYAMGTRPVWDEGGWQDKIDLTSMARAFDYPGKAADGPVPRFVIADVPDTLVDELKAPSLAAYLEYVDDMLARTSEVLASASEEQLKRRIDFYQSGQIPAHVLATGFSHCDRHIGMIEDIRGLIRGPGQGTATL